jgi:hypothetical protein
MASRSSGMACSWLECSASFGTGLPGASPPCWWRVWCPRDGFGRVVRAPDPSRSGLASGGLLRGLYVDGEGDLFGDEEGAGFEDIGSM